MARALSHRLAAPMAVVVGDGFEPIVDKARPLHDGVSAARLVLTVQRLRGT